MEPVAGRIEDATVVSRWVRLTNGLFDANAARNAAVARVQMTYIGDV